jgi:hypothetical protein
MEEPAVAGAAQHLHHPDPSSRDSGEQSGNDFKYSSSTSNGNDAITTLSATPPQPERRSIVPPYWQRQDDSNCTTLNKNASAETLSRTSLIRLEDHTDEGSEQCKALWAKRVTIDDYVIVSGSAPAVGSYVVWNCTVETLDVSLSRSGIYGCPICLTHAGLSIPHRRGSLLSAAVY